MALTGLAIAYGISNAPRAVSLTAPTLGTPAEAHALDAVVRRSMDASSFTRRSRGETLIYGAPNRTDDQNAFVNDPYSFATTITIGSQQYDLFGQLLGQAGCWVESSISLDKAPFGRPYAMSNLEALLGYRTALRRGDHFTVEKVVPATLQSVRPIGMTLTTSRKAYNEAVRGQRALAAYLHSKGLLRITTTVTTKGGFVARVAVRKEGTFVTADNNVISSGLNFSYSYGDFNSSPPVAPPPAIDVAKTSPSGQINLEGANGSASCASSIGVFPVKGVTTAVQDQYLTLSKPLLAANDAFVNAVIPHYTTTLNANAKRLGGPLVGALAKANRELAGDTWPAGVQAKVDHLIKARRTFIADIENLPATGYVTTAWTRKLYDDGAAAGNIEDTLLRDLGLSTNDST